MEHKPLILQVFLFLVGLVIFNWPMMAIAAIKGSIPLFVYLFTAWILFIAISWLIICLVTRTKSSKQSGRSEDV
jgi:membrane protein implicated in regulation of membrane protease activity